jgi:hypothetical protein
MSEPRNGHSFINFQELTVPGSLAMNDDRKEAALDAWYRRFSAAIDGVGSGIVSGRLKNSVDI